MAKKLSLLMAAVAVLAFAIPAFANAAPAVTLGGGEKELAPAGPGETGSTLVGTSTNVVTSSSLGLLKCEHVEVTAWLTKNSGTEVEASHDPGETNKATNCFAGKIPVSITDPTLTTLIATATTKTVSLDFTLPELGCTFSGTVPFTYTPGGNSIHIQGSLTPSVKACGESAEINGDFTVAIGGTDVILD
jgi:hypothetical protein